MKHFLLIIILAVFASNVDIQYSSSKRFKCVGGEDAMLIIDNKIDTSYIFGHQLGLTSPEIWYGDTTLIFSSGCCEALWFFLYDTKSKRIYYLKNQRHTI